MRECFDAAVLTAAKTPRVLTTTFMPFAVARTLTILGVILRALSSLRTCSVGFIMIS